MSRSVLPRLAVLVAVFGTTSPSFAMPQIAARPAGAALHVAEVKLKCKLTDDGRLYCTKKKKKKKKNKCAGPNDCGYGYGDLDQPNQYGACCEEIKDEAKNESPEEEATKEVPETGGSPSCRQVENANQMNCKAPFGAISCSAVENGTMNCCCVK